MKKTTGQSEDSLIMSIAASWLLESYFYYFINKFHKLLCSMKGHGVLIYKYHVNWMLCSWYHLGSYFYYFET